MKLAQKIEIEKKIMSINYGEAMVDGVIGIISGSNTAITINWW